MLEEQGYGAYAQALNAEAPPLPVCLWAQLYPVVNCFLGS